MNKAIKFDSVEQMVNHFQQSQEQAMYAVFYATDQPQVEQPAPLTADQVLGNPALATEKLAAQPVVPPPTSQEQPQKAALPPLLPVAPPVQVKAANVLELAKNVQEAHAEVDRLTALKQTAKTKKELKTAKGKLIRALNKYQEAAA